MKNAGRGRLLGICFGLLLTCILPMIATACIGEQTAVSGISDEPEQIFSENSEESETIETPDTSSDRQETEAEEEEKEEGNTDIEYDLSRALDGSLMAYLTKNPGGGGYTLIVRGTGEMVYTQVPWKEYSSVITDLVLTEGVTKIRENAFFGMVRLDTVSIPNGVTEIGASAFAGCSSLRVLKVPQTLKTVASGAFDELSALETVYAETLEGWLSVDFADRGANPLSNGADLWIAGAAFTQFTAAEETEEIGNYQFCGCTSLKEITLCSKIERIGDGAFADCTDLEILTFTGTDVEGQRIDFGNEWNEGTSFRSAILWSAKIGKTLVGLDGVDLYIDVNGESVGVNDLSAGTELYLFATNRSWDRVRYQGIEYYVKCGLISEPSDCQFMSVTNEVKLEIKEDATVKLRKAPFISQESGRSEENVVLTLTAADITETKPLFKVGVSNSGAWYEVTYNGDTYYLAYSSVANGDVIPPNGSDDKFGGMHQFG